MTGGGIIPSVTSRPPVCVLYDVTFLFRVARISRASLFSAYICLSHCAHPTIAVVFSTVTATCMWPVLMRPFLWIMALPLDSFQFI